jgi:hypothetical protein
MLNDHSVVYCDIDDNLIKVIDLRNQSTQNVSHNFMSDCTAAIELEFFPDTKLMGLVERGTSNDHRLMISYYALGEEKLVEQY